MLCVYLCAKRRAKDLLALRKRKPPQMERISVPPSNVPANPILSYPLRSDSIRAYPIRSTGCAVELCAASISFMGRATNPNRQRAERTEAHRSYNKRPQNNLNDTLATVPAAHCNEQLARSDKHKPISDQPKPTRNRATH